MGSQQMFCLRWNNHQTNLLNVFDQLLQTESFVDVTIACEGVSMKAHKVILSACSPYFQSLFMDNPCQHPIVILQDVRFCEMKALLDFMYKGEVNVTQEQLTTLLKCAETLKVKGLAEVASGAVNNSHQNGSNIPPQNAIQPPIRASSPIDPIPAPHLVAIGPVSASPVIPHQVASPIPPALDPIRKVPTPRPGSPPNKRKRMTPRRRSVEVSHSDAEDDSDSFHATRSPPDSMLEAKVEVLTDSYSDKQSDGVAERHIDAEMDNSQDERNMTFHPPGENESFSNSSDQSLSTRHHLPLSLISSSIPSTSRTPSGNQAEIEEQVSFALAEMECNNLYLEGWKQLLDGYQVYIRHCDWEEAISGARQDGRRLLRALIRAVFTRDELRLSCGLGLRRRHFTREEARLRKPLDPEKVMCLKEFVKMYCQSNQGWILPPEDQLNKAFSDAIGQARGKSRLQIYL